MLHCRSISLKFVRDALAQRNSDQVKTASREMAIWLLRNAHIETVFVDESSFRKWVKHSCGRAIGSKRAIPLINARQGGPMSVIFAVFHVTSRINHEFVDGGFRRQNFNAFLERVSLQLQNPNVFIRDNTPCHNQAQEANLKTGHQVIFQPAYSPFFNLCEGSFSI